MESSVSHLFPLMYERGGICPCGACPCSISLQHIRLLGYVAHPCSIFMQNIRTAQIFCTSIYVQAFPCCMSIHVQAFPSMSRHFHAACPCCVSMLHVLAAYPCCMPWRLSTLYVHTASPCCMSKLHENAAYSCYMNMLHEYVAWMCCIVLGPVLLLLMQISLASTVKIQQASKKR
jgi:hypothetical protein